MLPITTMSEAERRLAPFYANARPIYTLTLMRQLMTFLGNPQEQFRTVHVAGTSGKTSTAYYVAALLHEAGYKTGLTVSPHVDSLTERLQMNGQPVDEKEFCETLSKFLMLIEASKLQPSWFEVMVAFAYWYFAQQKVDYAVVEVGLGGLRDGTNVIKRSDKVCIITDIGLDHTQILGNTLAEITTQKAGIIQPGNTVFCYRQSPEILDVIERTAKQQGAELHIINESADTALETLPVFQQRNFQLAEAASADVLQVARGTKLTVAQKHTAAQAYIPGRMETIRLGDKIIILDGSHNAQKLTALAGSLHVKYPHEAITALVGFVEGDEARLGGALDVLGDITDHVIVTTFVTAKDYIKYAVEPDVVAALCTNRHITTQIIAEPPQAFVALMTRPEPILLVTGSFYLLNHIRPLMLK